MNGLAYEWVMAILHSTFLLCSTPEIECLSEHGIMLPPNMVGLTKEQIMELKLRDEFEEVCVPSGGFIESVDPVGRRNGTGKEAAISLVTTITTAGEFLFLK